MMIPPIDDSVLQNNPDFAVLYKRLTTEVLAPDGCSKNDPADRKRNQVKDVSWFPPFPLFISIFFYSFYLYICAPV